LNKEKWKQKKIIVCGGTGTAIGMIIIPASALDLQNELVW
jgi:hypothetical protein